jgi:triosephosphate isomerase
MRQSLVIGNWKMNGSLAANAKLVKNLAELIDGQCAQTALCVPFVYLSQVSELLQQSAIAAKIALGAQDVSLHLNGAYTGETSAAMLVDMGCEYVIVGHSERREYHHESSMLVAQKALAVLQSKLTPVICVGETLEQRESKRTLDIVGEQLSAVKNVIGSRGLARSVIAYEPVWAIGTGLTATPEQAQSVHRFIREHLGNIADDVSIIYGGSVKAENAKILFDQRDIDGALVGGASLNAQDFFTIAASFKCDGSI